MVSVLDKNKKPLDPCSNARARLLLKSKRARVHRIYPVFTIRLVDRAAEDSVVHPLRLGIDPGSKITGLALSMPLKSKEKAVCLIELEHRGDKIHKALLQRKAFRRTRRFRKTRYRKARFLNRKKNENWLHPSVNHRVLSVLRVAEKLRKHFNINQINVETARFDTQKLQNPEISGIEYQRGTLQGWDVREYILWKYGHECVYCGTKKAKFEIDHVIPKSKGGTDRVDNLVLSCHDCNQKKDDLSLEEFCPSKADKIKRRLKAPLKDAGVMNSIRFRLADELRNMGIPIKTSFGSQTKFNRHVFNIPKEHCLDALFSGETRSIQGWEELPVIEVKCVGRGTRSRTLLDAHGFPRAFLPRKKVFFGFQTGDMAEARVSKGKKAGVYVGRVAVRSSGSFNINTGGEIVQGINHKYFRLLQRQDGCGYKLSWRSESRNSFPS